MHLPSIAGETRTGTWGKASRPRRHSVIRNDSGLLPCASAAKEEPCKRNLQHQYVEDVADEADNRIATLIASPLE